MARRSDHSRDELYDLAVGAAREIVKSEGLEGLTARAVAKAIGYSPGTLYNLFEDRGDLILHVNGRTMDDLDAELSSLSVSGRVLPDLTQLLHGYMNFLRHNQKLWNAVFDYRLPEGQPLPDWYLQKIGRLLGLVEVALAPLFSAQDAERRSAAARVLWASLHGICSLADAGKLQIFTTQNADEMAELLVSNFVAGIAQSRTSAAKP